jgi:hypothetical protein
MPAQSELSAADIKKKLVGYTLVKPTNLSKLKPGDRIRYMSNTQFRAGGAIRANHYPDYIVLVNLMNKASWCMQLKDPTLKVWSKSMNSINLERKEMQDVYEMYKAGKLAKKK